MFLDAEERRRELLDCLSNTDKNLSNILHKIELEDDMNACMGFMQYNEEDILMVVIDVDGDYYYTAINENGCIETIDLDCNCYEKVGEYTLIETVIRLLNRCREDLKNRE